MVNHQERQRRRDLLLKWYYSHKTQRERSVERRLVCERCAITEDTFYKMLEGRTYIREERRKVINQIINRNLHPEFQHIFEI